MQVIKPSNVVTIVRHATREHIFSFLYIVEENYDNGEESAGNEENITNNEGLISQLEWLNGAAFDS